MIKEDIKQHPNTGKWVLCTEAYLQMRYALIEQIATIERTIQGTVLHNEWDITRRLLPSLKRQLNGLERRFQKMHCDADIVMCAQCILDWEAEIKDPLQCCRYYDGITIEKGTTKTLMAEYEMRWLEWRCAAHSTDNYRYMVDMIKEYMYYGLMMFEDSDKAPVSLKALLFNRYCHWNYGSADAFKSWYKNTYTAEAIR